METLFLDILSANDIKPLATSGVYDRGISYYKNGHVHDLAYQKGTLTAQVSGGQSQPYEVVIVSAKKELHNIYCSCFYALDGEVCKHVVATLFQWIEQRNNKTPFHFPPHKQNPFADPDYNMVFGINSNIPYSFGKSKIPYFLIQLFSSYADYSIKVNLFEGGPQLELAFSTANNGKGIVLRIPAGKSPYVFENLKKTLWL